MNRFFDNVGKDWENDANVREALASQSTKINKENLFTFAFPKCKHFQSKSPTKLSSFDLGKPIGRGGFGQVILARHKTHNEFAPGPSPTLDGFIVAIKLVFVDGSYLKDIHKEAVIHHTLCQPRFHPNIVSFYGMFYDSACVCFILEFAPNGTLRGRQNASPERRLPERLASHYLGELASALQFCHSRNVVHRDIKPENILIGVDGKLKLSDFGSSIFSDKLMTDYRAGTAPYRAPEMLNNKPYDKTVDIWAAGVSWLELLTGRHPFLTRGCRTSVLKQQVNIPIQFCDNGLPEEANNLLSQMLAHQPSQRLSWEDIQDHAWIKEIKDWNNEELYQDLTAHDTTPTKQSEC